MPSFRSPDDRRRRVPLPFCPFCSPLLRVFRVFRSCGPRDPEICRPHRTGRTRRATHDNLSARYRRQPTWGRVISYRSPHSHATWYLRQGRRDTAPPLLIAYLSSDAGLSGAGALEVGAGLPVCLERSARQSRRSAMMARICGVPAVSCGVPLLSYCSWVVSANAALCK